MHLSASGQLAFDLKAFLLPSATKLRRLCFYKCVSVHRGGGGVPEQVPPPGTRHTPPRTRHTTPGPDTHPDQVHHPPGTTPPEQVPPRDTATAADGTHPTGMHSCFLFFFQTTWPYRISAQVLWKTGASYFIVRLHYCMMI